MLPSFPEEREVFERRLGRLHVVDTVSDADDIMGKFTDGGGALRFKITYAGELKAGGKKSRREEKDRIRTYISSQLEELSAKHPVFQARGLVFYPSATVLPSGRAADARYPTGPTPPPKMVHVASNMRDIGLALTDEMEVQGRRYLPLVRHSLALTCGLDILFMRKDGPGPLIAEGGDLDNRIKTLFDGLRVPKPDEVGPPATQDEAGALTFCLLEDDALITDFAVRTDHLLTHPGASESEVLLVIDVAIRVSHLTSYNLRFLSE